MGANSIYSRGLPNVFDGDPDKLREGETLCTSVLEPLIAYSRLSISYGYISPELSQKIVKYQDPKKPSYHRWDAGAACDVVLHDRVALDEPPVRSAFWIDDNLPVSRTISYSESPFLCVATRQREVANGTPRRALYENRYLGNRKPQFISYSTTPSSRARQKEECQLEFDWKGKGYPTYHGGGEQQLHHIRTSRYTVLTDFLYNVVSVTEGFRNVPTQRGMSKFRRAGELYDGLIDLLGIRRLSIIRGYESPDWTESLHNWRDGIFLIVIPPADVNPKEVSKAARRLRGVRTTHVGVNRRVGIGADFTA